MDLDLKQSIISKYNVDKNQSLISVNTVEVQQVHPLKNLIQASGVIDEFKRVKIINKSMYEVFNVDDIQNSNQYYVDYKQGIIYFHPKLAGNTIQFEYGNLGIDYISGNRIFVKQDEKGNIVEVLQDLIDDVNNAVVTTGIIKENYSANIPSNGFSYNSSSGFYEYTLKHNLNSNKITINVYQNNDPVMNLCRVIDSNTVLVRNDEQVDLKVIINYGSVS